MSKKNRKKQTKSQSTDQIRLFSEKEREIIKQEMDDQEAPNRNLPVLRRLLKENPEYHDLLFDTFQMSTVMYSLQQQLQASNSLSGRSIESEQFFEQVVQSLAPMVDPELVLSILVDLARQTKIKRHKRVLLWACAEMLVTLANQRQPHESHVIRTLVLVSGERSMEMTQSTVYFLEGKEPYNFDYEILLEGRLDDVDWEHLESQTQHLQPDFVMAIFSRALNVFEHLQSEVGLRFFYIPHYAENAQSTKKSLIYVPGQESHEDDNLSDEEKDLKKMEAMHKGLTIDMQSWSLEKIVPQILQQFKSSLFGKFHENELRFHMNAVAYTLMHLQDWNPFLIRLYELSGENAKSVNPYDETNYIIDILSSPESAIVWKRYGDWLYEKNEREGAGLIYNMYMKKADPVDEEIQQRRDELLQETSSNLVTE